MKPIFLFLCLIFSYLTYGAVEVNGNFGYSKEVYGVDEHNSSVKRSYSAAIALYFLYYTGLEFNYSYDQDIVTENDIQDLGDGLRLISKQSLLNIRSYGVGLRQGLSSRNATVSPVISVGYAKQFYSGGNSYTFDYNGETRFFYFPFPAVTNDAVFGQFTLRIRLTQLFSINGSVKTVFKASEYKKAQNNLKYQAGFSWIM